VGKLLLRLLKPLIDQLREEQLKRIVEIQQQQLVLLKQISENLAGIRQELPPEA